MGAAGGPALGWASQLWFALLDRVPLSDRVLFVVRTDRPRSELRVGWVGWCALHCTIRLIVALLPYPQLGMYLVSEVWYLAIAGFYYTLWTQDWLLRYRIQKKAAMPDPALIKVYAKPQTNHVYMCVYVL